MLSNNSYFTFLGSHSFKVQPFTFPTTSVIGKRVTTVCATTTGGKVDFKWLKNGKEISKTSKVIMRSFPEFSTLIIDPVAEDDSGNYTCIATARGISESFTALLDVLGTFIFLFNKNLHKIKNLDKCLFNRI